MSETAVHKILVVEDDEDVIIYLSTWLKDKGYEVEVARNGVEATEKVKSFQPDLITLDIVMPGKTGVRFYREVRKDPATAHIPIIIITGLEGEFQKFISHRKSAPPPDGYIQKPFSEEELLSELGKVVSKFREKQKLM